MSFVSWAFVLLFFAVFAARLTIGRRKIEPAYVAVLLVSSTVFSVSYTHLTLPTICSV